MEIKLKADIRDDRMLDGLLAAMNAINLINEAADKSITLDFSEIEFVTPSYVLPLVAFLNSCDKDITFVNLKEYLQKIEFADGMCPDRMRKSEFLLLWKDIHKRHTYL